MPDSDARISGWAWRGTAPGFVNMVFRCAIDHPPSTATTVTTTSAYNVKTHNMDAITAPGLSRLLHQYRAPSCVP